MARQVLLGHWQSQHTEQFQRDTQNFQLSELVVRVCKSDRWLDPEG